MRKVLLASAALLALTASAQTQTLTSSGDYCGVTSCRFAVTTCCGVSQPSEDTLAAWAADHAVASQLESKFPGEKAVGKLQRADLDALAARIDDLCKWAKGLSNHILRGAYIRWTQKEQNWVDDRRSTLDKLEVAKGLVLGLPQPPEGK